MRLDLYSGFRRQLSGEYGREPNPEPERIRETGESDRAPGGRYS